MSNKEIIFITGANTGLGFEAIRSLFQSSKPYHILLGSRSATKGADALARATKEFPDTKSTAEVIEIDISNDESIDKAVATISGKFDHLDALVNNAGASFDTTFDKDAPRLRQLFNDSWNTNVSGTLVLTSACVPLLLAAPSPCLIFLTSGLSSLENGSKMYIPGTTEVNKNNLRLNVAYRSSKTGLNMAMLAWHHTLQGDGVRVWAISPGFLATNLGIGSPETLKTMGAGEAWLGGDIIKRVIEGERDADVGKVVNQDGKVQPW